MGKGSVGKKSTTSGRIGAIGLSGAPPEHERVGQPESVSSQAPETASSQRRTQERPVQYTIRLSYDESDDLDSLARALRKRRGRSTASSDVLRGLVALAKDDPELQRRLAAEIESS